MKRTACSLLITVCSLLFLFVKFSWALPPQVQDITVTDVTPVSFSVIWASDQPSSCDILVYTDQNGSSDITASLAITPHPTRNGDPTIVSAAKNRGVMKVQVSGLESATRYYFRTKTRSVPGGEETFSPLNGPYPSVTTQTAAVKTAGTGLDYLPFTNHLIYQDVFENNGTTPASGALLLAAVDGASYPLSTFVGDGLTSPGAAIDLNNLYSEFSGKTLVLEGGQKILLTKFYGNITSTESPFVIPRNNNLLSLRPPNGLAEAILILQAMTEPMNGPDLSVIADITQDDRIGLQESLHIMQIVAQML